jgi:hypothetical protein
VTEILSYNRERYWAVITNNSSTVCYIGLTEGLSVNNGIQLNQNDVFVITLVNPYSGPIYGITGSGIADLRVMEISKPKG